MVMIDFVKITDDLWFLDFLKIFFTFIAFLFWMGGVCTFSKMKEKNIVTFIFGLIMVATFFGTPHIGISGLAGMKEILKKAKITNIKNLKTNRKIVEDAIKYNSAVKDKDEYINTLLNKFYINGKDTTPDEKKLMQKLKK